MMQTDASTQAASLAAALLMPLPMQHGQGVLLHHRLSRGDPAAPQPRQCDRIRGSAAEELTWGLPSGLLFASQMADSEARGGEVRGFGVRGRGAAWLAPPPLASAAAADAPTDCAAAP